MIKNLPQRITRRLIDPIQYWYMTQIRSKKQFTLGDKNHHYNFDQYNFSWANERSVEIPIFQNLLKESKKSAKILEVGNVLSHYQSVNHKIIDKYEKSRGVINQDIERYEDKEKYDLIFSISTLEHVGWDEKKKDKNKIIKSFSNLKSLLKKGGEIWFSVPLGYNSYLDEIIDTDKLPLTKTLYLKRVSGFTNLWKEIKKPKISKCHYAKPYPHANVLMISMYNSK